MLNDEQWGQLRSLLHQQPIASAQASQFMEGLSQPAAREALGYANRLLIRAGRWEALQRVDPFWKRMLMPSLRAEEERVALVERLEAEGIDALPERAKVSPFEGIWYRLLLGHLSHDVSRRRGYLMEAARLFKDSLRNQMLAMQTYERVLLDDPLCEEAFDALDALLDRRREWQKRVEIRLAVLEQLEDEEDQRERRAALWKTVAQFRGRLRDANAALEAAREAERLAPGDPEVAEMIARLER